MNDEIKRALKESFEYEMTNVHTCFPGSIVSYDPDTRRAEIQPFLKRKVPGGKYLNFPIITDVPVRFSGTKKFTVHITLEKGDEVMVLVCERATDVWRDKGAVDIEDPDPRRYSLMDCFAVPGLQPKEFIAVKEKGLVIKHHTNWNGDFISHVIMDDDKIEARYKKKAEVLMKDDFIQAITEEQKVLMTGKNIDVESPNPIGIKGTGTLLGAGALLIFLKALLLCYKKNPLIIPPMPLPPGFPVLPVPPFIDMYLFRVQNDWVAALEEAISNLEKVVK
jgi:hypothetical protein